MKIPIYCEHCGELIATFDTTEDTSCCEYYESDDIYGCKLANDALAYIRQIESRLAQVEMERDLLVSGLEQSCDTCKHRENMSFHAPCNTCSHLYRFNAAERGDTDNWEWRGVCEENTKDGNEGKA